MPKKRTTSSISSNSDSDSDSGPEVVKFDDPSTTSTTHTPTSKRERKLFMGAQDDKESLEKDIALQRLISESHILAEGRDQFSGADISTDFDPIGKTRHKTLSSRLESLGGISDKNAKQRAPMNIQQGINAKRQERKEKHEKYAKEAGIVLARPTSSVKKAPIKRDKGLKIASVGKNTRHGLKISEKDIQKVSGKSKSFKKGKRKPPGLASLEAMGSVQFLLFVEASQSHGGAGGWPPAKPNPRIATVRTLSAAGGGLSRPPAETRAELYGLYKQATEGDVDGLMERPAGDELSERKWDAWKSFEGLKPTEAKKRYITLLIETMRSYAGGTPQARELLNELETMWDQVRDLSSSSSSHDSPLFGSLGLGADPHRDAERRGADIAIARERAVGPTPCAVPELSGAGGAEAVGGGVAAGAARGDRRVGGAAAVVCGAMAAKQPRQSASRTPGQGPVVHFCITLLRVHKNTVIYLYPPTRPYAFV
ncbi:hypothetical protein TRICI_006550 [Trichomonascus ciferrii]|uniref:ACB domain-containing protein n=1 Tax=Trichomonascus ciferrii TaxID=44093 RepID=A0A642UGI1_9ASCO|nr:hypothetical protein TRICI_006550 [Trichomonascus ciferrii]